MNIWIGEIIKNEDVDYDRLLIIRLRPALCLKFHFYFQTFILHSVKIMIPGQNSETGQNSFFIGIHPFN